MPDTRGIPVAISNRRSVFTDDPEYDRLVLEALNADDERVRQGLPAPEDPREQLQPDERAYAEQLRAQAAKPATFRSQNDPAADRARLGMPEDAPYASTMGQVLNMGGGPTRDPRSEAERLQAVEAVRTRLASQSRVQQLNDSLDLQAGPRMSAAPPLARSTARISAAPASMWTVAGNSLAAAPSGVIRGLKTANVLDDTPTPIADQAALDERRFHPKSLLGGDTSRIGPPKESRFKEALRAGYWNMRGVGAGEEEPETTGTVLGDMLADPTNWLEFGKAPVAMAAAVLGKPKKLVAAVKRAGTMRALLETSPAAKKLARAAERGVSGAAEGNALLARLRPSLDAPQLRRLESALSQSPEVMEHLQHLLPEEIPTLLKSNSGINAFVQRVQELPATNVLKAAAAIGDVKLGWYERSRLAIEHLFGDDADLFAGVLASSSPQTSVESNLTNALNFFVNWRAAGRPRDAQQVQKLFAASVQGGTEKSALKAWLPNLISVVTEDAQTLSGSKVDSFWSNLRSRWKETPYGKIGPDQTVVLDAWMSHIFGVPGEKWFGGSGVSKAEKLAGDPGLKATYLAGTAKVRAVAKALNISPAEAQETMWSTAYALYNKSKKLRLTPADVLQRGLLTVEDIGGTPDFATLLGSGSYGAIVSRDADLASRMPSLANIPARQSRSLPRDPDFAESSGSFARTLGNLMDARQAEKSTKTGLMPKNKLVLLAPSEIVGDPGVTSILPYDEVAPPQRASGSKDIAGARQNPFGHNAALRAVVGPTAPQQGRVARGTGTWAETLPDGTKRLQQNPMTTTGLLVPSDAAARRPIEQQVRAVTNMQAGMTGQTAQSHILLDMRAPEARWNAVDVSGGSNSKPIKPDQFKALVQNLSPDWVAVQKDRGVQFLHLDPETNMPLPVVPADVTFLQRQMQTHIPQVNAKNQPLVWNTRPAENVAEDGYRVISGNAAPGSRLRTERMVGPESEWKLLSKEQKMAADPHFQREATAILQTMKRLKRTLRGDEQNLLTIVSKGGASALARALKDPNQVLPVLAGLGIALPAAMSLTEEPRPY